jgi:ribosomal protein S18 acetylase RimI-like enzyme
MKTGLRPRLRQGQREDADLIVRLIDVSSHGGIGAHYRAIYGADIDWKSRARLEIASGGDELGFQNAILVSVGKEEAGGMILNALRSVMVTSAFDESRSGHVERMIAKAAGSLFIRELAVFSPFQGQGIGRLLVEVANTVALERAIGAVSLTVNADNTPAVALYANCGFVETFRQNIDGHDMLLMMCEAR